MWRVRQKNSWEHGFSWLFIPANFAHFFHNKLLLFSSRKLNSQLSWLYHAILFAHSIGTQRNHFSNLPKFWTEFLSRNLIQLNKFEIFFPEEMNLLVPSLTACFWLVMSKEHTVKNLELDNERLYEVYQNHFNQTFPYKEAGYHSVLELFTRGQTNCPKKNKLATIQADQLQVWVRHDAAIVKPPIPPTTSQNLLECISPRRSCCPRPILDIKQVQLLIHRLNFGFTNR